jgi:predicted outer membrane protein
MSRNTLFASAVLALTCSLCLSADPKVRPDPVGPAPVVAGQAAQTRPAAQVRPAVANVQAAPVTQSQQQWQWKNPDHALASCVAIGNQEEIALSELASQRAQNDDVKKFAQMLIHDHQEFLAKLRPYAPEASAAGFLKVDNREVRTNNAARSGIQQAGATQKAAAPSQIQTTAGTRPAENMNQGFRHLQIEREVAEQCLAGATEKLSTETGAHFDKCFIGQQIAMHMGMKSKLIVYQHHASSELAALLAEGQKKVEEHLAKAEDLMKTLDHDAKTTSNTTNRKEKVTNKD